jgi:hypothetical protein
MTGTGTTDCSYNLEQLERGEHVLHSRRVERENGQFFFESMMSVAELSAGLSTVVVEVVATVAAAALASQILSHQNKL